MNGRCVRFDREGMSQLEATRGPSDHDRSCPDCQRARALHQRIAGALAEESTRRGPRPGWQQRVLISVRAERTKRRFLTIMPALAAAVMLLAIGWSVRRGSPPVLALRAEVAPGAHRTRGETTGTAGDSWRVRGEARGVRHAELRVWRDGRELLARSPGLTVTVPLATGRYEAFLIAGERALPPPAATASEDLDRLSAAGARIERTSPLMVW
jgi:hypothetical protein